MSGQAPQIHDHITIKGNEWIVIGVHYDRRDAQHQAALAPGRSYVKYKRLWLCVRPVPPDTTGTNPFDPDVPDDYDDGETNG